MDRNTCNIEGKQMLIAFLCHQDIQVTFMTAARQTWSKFKFSCCEAVHTRTVITVDEDQEKNRQTILIFALDRSETK